MKKAFGIKKMWNMKCKYTLFLPILAIICSCNKEQAVNEEKVTVSPVSIIAVINNDDESDMSKTTYEIDESTSKATFYWKGEESFARVIRHFNPVAAESTYYDNYYADVFTSSGEKATLRSFTCEDPLAGNYEDMKVAFYPYFENNKTNVSFPVGSSTTFTYSIEGELDYNLSNALDQVVPMVGYLTEDGYDFKPLTGLLAIKMTGIPSTATKLTISSASYKMWGTTVTITSQTAKTQAGTALTGLKRYSYDRGLCQSLLSGSNTSKSYIFEGLDDAETYTFYFPMPISASHGSDDGTPIKTLDDLSVKLYNDNSEEILSKSANEPITIKRGYITRLPLITGPGWELVGAGKFIDNHLWGKMGFGNNTFAEVGAVDVKIYQNTSDNTKYRIRNPYGQAAAFLSAENKTQGEHDEYLTFTVSDGMVTFDDHLTGYSISGENVSIKHVSSSHNKLIAGTWNAPKIVQLAPEYKGTTSFDDNCSSADNKLQIIFPNAVDDYVGSFTIKNNKADLSSGVDYTLGSPAERVCIYISDTPIYDYFSKSSSNVTISTGPGSRTTKSSSGSIASSTLGYGQSGSTYDQSASGVKYLTWSTWNNNTGNVLYRVGCKKFYGIVPGHKDAYIQNYTMYHGDGSATITMTLEVSDDPEKGNVKLTNFAGITGTLYGVYNSSAKTLTFYNSRTTAFAENVYIYSNNTYDQNNLNFAVGIDTSQKDNYGRKNWKIVSANAYIILKNTSTGETTTYDYMRGGDIN